MTKNFGRWVAIPDGFDAATRTGTAAVLDRTTDKPVVSGLPGDEAEQLARDWNRHEPPEIEQPPVVSNPDGSVDYECCASGSCEVCRR